MTERTSSLAPFAHPVFRDVWVASLASNLGALIQAVGAAWLMTSIAASADLVALVQASTTLPVMIFSLASGALADSFDRRRVMIVAQLFMLTISIALALFAWLGTMSPWLLLGFTFLIGCGTALNNPSWQASVGDMVPRSALPAAVALNSVNFNLTRSVGPAIGGLIVATAGAAAAFAVLGVLQHRAIRPAPGSVLTMGPALSIALTPTLVLAVGTDDLPRLALVLVAGIACLVVGAGRGLRAPLLAGAGTLGVVALMQGSPYLAYVPTWLLLGLAGAVLLTLGVAWESALNAGRQVGRWAHALR